MKITRIGDLFSLARGGEETQGQPKTTKVQEAGSQENAEAIRIASDFGSGANPLQEAERQKRLEELKKKVADGSYRPDSREVAKSVYQDLFA